MGRANLPVGGQPPRSRRRPSRVMRRSGAPRSFSALSKRERHALDLLVVAPLTADSLGPKLAGKLIAKGLARSFRWRGPWGRNRLEEPYFELTEVGAREAGFEALAVNKMMR